VIGRLRIDRRNDFTRDQAKDGTVQSVNRLKRARSEEMAATAQAVVIVVSRVWRRSLLLVLRGREG